MRVRSACAQQQDRSSEHIRPIRGAAQRAAAPRRKYFTGNACERPHLWRTHRFGAVRQGCVERLVRNSISLSARSFARRTIGKRRCALVAPCTEVLQTCSAVNRWLLSAPAKSTRVSSRVRRAAAHRGAEPQRAAPLWFTAGTFAPGWSMSVCTTVWRLFCLATVRGRCAAHEERTTAEDQGTRGCHVATNSAARGVAERV